MGSGPSTRTELASFSNKLIPSEDYIRKGKVVVTQLYNILRKYRRDVDRVVLADSIGKRTLITEQADFTCVVFLNKMEPPFDDVLHEMRNSLMINKHKMKNFHFISQTFFFISFEVDGMKFELDVASNLKSWQSTQYEETMKRIVTLDDPIKYGFMYSPGLAEPLRLFMRRQSKFAHSVIRLAKYWNNKIEINAYVTGRSHLIQAIALHACLGETNDIFKAFKKFLELMIDFNSIYFYFTECYSISEIPTDIFKQKPLVLDPINPYSNLAKMHFSSINVFMSAAKMTLDRLEEFQPGEDNFERIEAVF